MANVTRTQSNDGKDESPPSGVPSSHDLGAAKKEALWLALAVVLLALIALSFWYEAGH